MPALQSPLCLVLFEDITSLPQSTDSFHEAISDYEVVLQTKTIRYAMDCIEISKNI